MAINQILVCYFTAHEHYFKDYKNEKFNLDAIEKQQRIVDILKEIENIIESRQQELQKLDDLIRSPICRNVW